MCFPLDVRTELVDLVCGGMSILAAARRVGVTHGTGRNWWAQSGRMMTMDMGAVGGLQSGTLRGKAGRPGDESGRTGTIQMGRRSGMSYAAIGEAIGRDKSVVWREVNRNTGADGVYYAWVAHTKAHRPGAGPSP